MGPNKSDKNLLKSNRLSSINDIGEVHPPNHFQMGANASEREAKIALLEEQIEQINQKHLTEMQDLMQKEMEQFMNTDMKRINLEKNIVMMQERLNVFENQEQKKMKSIESNYELELNKSIYTQDGIQGLKDSYKNDIDTVKYNTELNNQKKELQVKLSKSVQAVKDLQE